MKKIKLLFVVLSVILAVSGCNKDNFNGSGSGIKIKGKIASAKNVSATRKSSSGLSLADAKKVLVFSKYYYSLTDITDGAFTVSAEAGTGVALLFLTAENKYIGCLSSRGLNVFPLGNLSEGENTIIDLADLTLDGTNVIPSHDPFGNEIKITQAELDCLKAIGGYYEAIAKNIDADNDGNPDVLDKKQVVLYTMFAISAGHWGLNNELPTINDESRYYVNRMIEVAGGSGLTFGGNALSFTGPIEDPYSDIKLWGYSKDPGGDRGFIASFCRETSAQNGAPWGSAFMPFKKGTYKVTLDGSRSFTLNYSNIGLEYNLIIIVPTMHTNTEGKLTSIDFEYQLPDGTPINPESVMTNVMVQLSDKQHNQFYVNDKTKLTTKTGFSKLTLESPLDISTLNQMDIWYDDLLGNQYDIIWR